MSQPVQVFEVNREDGSSGATVATNSNLYCVVDNGAPGAAVGTGTGAPSNWTGTGFDNIATGANSQGTNAFGNGNIPDYVQNGKSFTCTTAGVFNIVRYKLPS